MPYIHITTNRKSSKKESELLKDISENAAKILAKPESYIMVRLETEKSLFFAGNNEPCCFAQVKSLGLSSSDTKDLSAKFCKLIEDKFQIKSDRIYIQFSSPERSFWGWDGTTF